MQTSIVSEGKQVIVFRETKGKARGCAGYLADVLGLSAAEAALAALPQADPSVASAALRETLRGGVAFHTAELDRDERVVIEDQFRAPGTPLRVIAATTTLAMGVNTPTEAVVIAGLMHPGDNPYSVAEYKNIVGRAGRLGFSERGTSYLLALNEHDHEVCGASDHEVCGASDHEDRGTRSVIAFVMPSWDPRRGGRAIP
jgi:replicative superfamily II helicase